MSTLVAEPTQRCQGFVLFVPGGEDREKITQFAQRTNAIPALREVLRSEGAIRRHRVSGELVALDGDWYMAIAGTTYYFAYAPPDGNDLGDAWSSIGRWLEFGYVDDARILPLPGGRFGPGIPEAILKHFKLQ